MRKANNMIHLLTPNAFDMSVPRCFLLEVFDPPLPFLLRRGPCVCRQSPTPYAGTVKIIGQSVGSQVDLQIIMIYNFYLPNIISNLCSSYQPQIPLTFIKSPYHSLPRSITILYNI